MTTIIINERSTEARKLVEYLRTQPFVTVVEEKKTSQTVAKPKNETKAGKSPYNEEFVKKIQESRMSKGKLIKTEDLWK